MNIKDIEFYKIPETIAIVRNWFHEDELSLIWSELEVLCSPFVLRDPEDTGAARDTNDKTILKIGHGIFIDSFYQERRDLSYILKFNRRVFSKELCEILIKEDPNFNHLITCTKDHTLVNYYENGDEYKTHKDDSIYTSNVILWKEPKQFTGGIFLIGKEKHDFGIKSNDMVIFPGYSEHSVSPMTMSENYTPWKSGRYSIANFCNYR